MSLGGQDCRISRYHWSPFQLTLPMFRGTTRTAQQGCAWQELAAAGAIGSTQETWQPGKMLRKGSKVKVCFEQSKIIVVEMVIQLFDPYIYIYIIIHIIIIIDNIYIYTHTYIYI